MRAVAGAVLAGHVVDARPGARRLHAQFGAYATFMAFGLARLPAASPDFRAICRYASSMAFELVSAGPPGPDHLAVRFLFANGSAAEHRLEPYPLFGQPRLALPWRDFKAAMAEFAVVDARHWCRLCGNAGAKCAPRAPSGLDAGSVAPGPSGDGVSKPVAAVIDALVVVLGVQAAVMLLGGLRLVKKSARAGACRAGDQVADVKP